MSITLIEQNPSFDKKVEGDDKLAIAEMFCDTLQGEGVTTGVPSTFIRLQGCTLKCTWCDTLDVWPNGNEYSFDEIFKMWEEVDLINKFKNGQHLVLTGGSPLKQQDRLSRLLIKFRAKYGFMPYLEIENEAVLMPNSFMVEHINQWNNSPKLANSGMKERARIKPDNLKFLSGLKNSWFKFVISSPEDWHEIEYTFLEPELITRGQIILMPEGQTQEELDRTRELTADLAIEQGVRFSDREHIVIWNLKTAV